MDVLLFLENSMRYKGPHGVSIYTVYHDISSNSVEDTSLPTTDPLKSLIIDVISSPKHPVSSATTPYWWHELH